MGSYLRTEIMHDALSALAERSYTVLAGGTDFFLPMSANLSPPTYSMSRA